VRLQENESAVVAGLIEIAETDTKSGIFGLSSIPVIGRLFSQSTHQKGTTDILLVMKPHLVNLPPWETTSPVMWIGTETHPVTLY
jgi:general secretion pathway protein D